MSPSGLSATDSAEGARSFATMLSTVGAGVAGVGLGALGASIIGGSAGMILAIGLISHLVGMSASHRLKAQAYTPASWEKLAYWACWAAIAGLLVFLIAPDA